MSNSIPHKAEYGLFKFFRSTLLALSDSEILDIVRQYENESKQIKDDVYRIGWYMRGSFTYDDLMFRISHEDREIISRIIKDNIERVNDTKMPLL